MGGGFYTQPGSSAFFPPPLENPLPNARGAPPSGLDHLPQSTLAPSSFPIFSLFVLLGRSKITSLQPRPFPPDQTPPLFFFPPGVREWLLFPCGYREKKGNFPPRVNRPWKPGTKSGKRFSLARVRTRQGKKKTLNLGEGPINHRVANGFFSPGKNRW